MDEGREGPLKGSKKEAAFVSPRSLESVTGERSRCLWGELQERVLGSWWCDREAGREPGLQGEVREGSCQGLAIYGPWAKAGPPAISGRVLVYAQCVAAVMPQSQAAAREIVWPTKTEIFTTFSQNLYFKQYTVGLGKLLESALGCRHLLPKRISHINDRFPLPVTTLTEPLTGFPL